MIIYVMMLYTLVRLNEIMCHPHCTERCQVYGVFSLSALLLLVQIISNPRQLDVADFFLFISGTWMYFLFREVHIFDNFLCTKNDVVK